MFWQISLIGKTRGRETAFYNNNNSNRSSFKPFPPYFLQIISIHFNFIHNFSVIFDYWNNLRLNENLSILCGKILNFYRRHHRSEFVLPIKCENQLLCKLFFLYFTSFFFNLIAHFVFTSVSNVFNCST